MHVLITGAAGFTKGSFGTLTVNSNNTYTGVTTVNAGILVVNGSQPVSPIVLTGGALEGTGTVATVTSVGSYVSPGITTGILTCSNVTLNPSSTFQVALNGTTAGSGYSQLNVNGSVVLSDAVLIASLGFTPALGASFVILNNDGSDPVTGIFKNLPEGATYTNTTVPLKISYVGGSGNDVTLTFLSPPTRFDSISRPTNGQVQLHAIGGISNFVYTLQATTNLVPVVQWSNIATATGDSNGRISFTDTNANRFPKRFYRVLSP